MHLEALRALDLLESRYKAPLQSLDKRDRDSFYGRLDQYFPQLFQGLHELYGHRWDFAHYLGLILENLANHWVDRSSDLKNLDQKRLKNPLWFQGNDQIGAMLYVDRFADNLKELKKKIEYLKDLGITYLHLMPLFKAPEPENDGGYAISTYRELDGTIGTIKDLEVLAQELRKEGISLVLDFVFNHTSNEHKWALAAQAGDKKYQSYYFVVEEQEAQEYNAHLSDIFPDIRKGSFTFNEEIQKWIWTSFHSYQWDLNYQNPAVFNGMLEEMLFLANLGTEVLRLDALAFIWKEKGTNCQNLPKAHTLIKCFRAAARIAAPSMSFKSEAIVHPDEVAKYISGEECDISYNPMLMALTWESLATRNVNLLEHSLIKRFSIASGTTWVNYVRCHDDIGWVFSDEDAKEMGIDGYWHRKFLNEFYIGKFDGSFARGVPFQFDPDTGDCRISGTAASLIGIEEAMVSVLKCMEMEKIAVKETYERILAESRLKLNNAIKRYLLIHSLISYVGGIPLIYIGDEQARLNWYDYKNVDGYSQDSRWIHRPHFDWNVSLSDLAEGNRRKSRIDSKDLVLPPNEEIPKDLEQTDLFNKVRRIIFNGIKEIIALRKKSKVFGGLRTDIVPNSNAHLLSFIRKTEKEQVFCIMNFSEASQVVDSNLLRMNSFYPLVQNMVDKKKIELEDNGLILQPYQYVVLKMV